MLRCPKCGTDNMLTAIFCRGCGEKIDLNQVKPESFSEIGTKKDNTTMQNIIGGAIIGVLLVVFLVGVLFPSCGKISTSEESRQAAVAKYEALTKGNSATFTDEDISNFVTAKLLDKGDISDNPKPTGATVHVLSDNKVKILATGKYYGLPVTITVNGEVSLNDRKISVAGEKCSIGLFPIPQSMEQDILGPFRRNFESALEDSNRKIKGLATAEGSATLTK